LVNGFGLWIGGAKLDLEVGRNLIPIHRGLAWRYSDLVGFRFV